MFEEEPVVQQLPRIGEKQTKWMHTAIHVHKQQWYPRKRVFLCFVCVCVCVCVCVGASVIERLATSARSSSNRQKKQMKQQKKNEGSALYLSTKA